MAIKNEAKIKNGLIVAIREQLEHRALWMYLLCDEAKKKGLPVTEYHYLVHKRVLLSCIRWSNPICCFGEQ